MLYSSNDICEWRENVYQCDPPKTEKALSPLFDVQQDLEDSFSQEDQEYTQSL